MKLFLTLLLLIGSMTAANAQIDFLKIDNAKTFRNGTLISDKDIKGFAEIIYDKKIIINIEKISPMIFEIEESEVSGDENELTQFFSAKNGAMLYIIAKKESGLISLIVTNVEEVSNFTMYNLYRD